MPTTRQNVLTLDKISSIIYLNNGGIMENTNNVEVTETLNTKTYKRNPLILLKPIPLKVFAIILLIFVIFFVILLKSSHGAILNTKNGASKLYIK